LTPEAHPVRVVLVSPRNPLNIGAAARAMANFGFPHLTVVAPYEPHWREAKSAVGAEELLQIARRTQCLAEAVAECTLVIGTGTLTHRKPEQPVVSLPALAPLVAAELARGGQIALIFGPEKHGLTREDLSRCQLLVEIPTDHRQPSMNLGQAVAVCLYELASRPANAARDQHALDEADLPSHGKSHPATQEVSGHDFSRADGPAEFAGALAPVGSPSENPFSRRLGPTAPSGNLDLLAGVIEETMTAAGYSPRSMQPANRHDLRLLLRRLAPSARDSRRILGLFRRILWRLEQTHKGN
jgi:tRNA/rRNA methyltransferase